MADNNGKLRINPSLAMQFVVWLVAALVTYGAIHARVSVVESQIELFRSDITEIKQDIKSLLRRP